MMDHIHNIKSIRDMSFRFSGKRNKSYRKLRLAYGVISSLFHIPEGVETILKNVYIVIRF